MKKYLFTRWQHLWHNSTSNILHNIYPSPYYGNSKYPKAQLTRREHTVYNRLRIGHTYLTHSYLLKDEDPPICIPCNSLLTVEHMIICIDFDIIRQNFYTASNLKDLFHNIHPKRIVSFIHTIGLTILNFLRHDIAATCVLKVPLNPDHPTNPQTHQPIILSILSICYLHRNNSNAIFCCVSPAIFASKLGILNITACPLPCSDVTSIKNTYCQLAVTAVSLA